MAKTILVVDDEEDLCEIYSFRIGEEGFEVITALNGKAAMEILKKQHIDMVIADVRMPEMNGVALLKTMKKEMKNPPPLIFVSGFSDISEDESLALGAKAFLSKPLEFDELNHKIKEIVGE